MLLRSCRFIFNVLSTLETLARVLNFDISTAQTAMKKKFSAEEHAKAGARVVRVVNQKPSKVITANIKIA